MNLQDKLIVALDTDDVFDAVQLVSVLGSRVDVYKIGYRLILADGFHLCKWLIRLGKKIFLDLKLHDIDHTVTETVKQAAEQGVTFLTVHGYPKTMKAAIAGRHNNLKLLAVTVLTSYDDEDCKEAGYIGGIVPMAALRARQALDLGIDGIVCSAHEATMAREGLGKDFIIVTPGIRLSFSPQDDQKRIKTANQALAAGADYVVVGRPIIEAEDPVAALAAILQV